jgi:5-formyltetrahydrofolate cyclo-ligase
MTHCEGYGRTLSHRYGGKRVTDDARQDKERLRSAHLDARQRRTDTERAAVGEAIKGHGIERWSGARTVAAFYSVGTEPPTPPLLDALLATGVRVLLPVIGGQLDWAHYTGPDSMTPGPLGINEPAGARLGPGALPRADVVIVPALAIDRAGNRLGRGRGFYDQALVAVTAPIIAIVYDDELVDRVPTEGHDRRVDAVLRPAGFTSFGQTS